jgi:CrcB protein
MILLAIGLAGAIGAPARFVVDGLVAERLGQVFPWGTFIINVSGSLLLGLLTGLALYHGFPSVPRAFLATGFCGAYTTFSTFGYETVRLADENAGLQAAANALGSLAAGLLAAAAGLALAAFI